MPRVFEGLLDGRKKKFGIVISRFNETVSARLLDGALDCLRRHNTAEESIDIAWVPGSFEIPYAMRKMAAGGGYHAVIALGALIRGATPHFDFIAAQVAKGVARVSEDEGMPVIFGVITADSMDQALERSGGKAGNKGWDAALSALEMADLSGKLKAGKR